MAEHLLITGMAPFLIFLKPGLGDPEGAIVNRIRIRVETRKAAVRAVV
jgi:hypothetical protein